MQDLDFDSPDPDVFLDRVYKVHVEAAEPLLWKALDSGLEDSERTAMMFAFYRLMGKTYEMLGESLKKHNGIENISTWPIDIYRLFPKQLMFSWSKLEELAWSVIRSSGVVFLPQYPFPSGFKPPKEFYRLDFANPWWKFCIEIDGSYHLNGQQKARDQIRDSALRDAGWSTFRFPATAVTRKNNVNLDLLLSKIDNGLQLSIGEKQDLSQFYCGSFEGFISCLRHDMEGSKIPDIILSELQEPSSSSFVKRVIDSWRAN
jgi:very-short-patch-repair endonuclease